MTKPFVSDFFSGNRRRLQTSAGDGGPIVITANGLLQRNSDSTYKFRQDSNFWYLTGIDTPDVVLVIDGTEEYLIVPGRDTIREAFDGAVDYGALSDISGITTVLDEDEGWRKLSGRLKKTGRAAVVAPPPEYIEHAGMYANPARQRLYGRIQSLCQGGPAETALTDVRPALAKLRVIKQDCELAAIQKAIDITIGGIEYSTQADRLRGYGFEFEAEVELSRYIKLHGAGGHAFEPIIVGGKRACTLHNLSMDAPLVATELIQFDVGAEYSLYAADISRVVAMREPSSRQRAVHMAVCDVQDYALSLLKPGVLLRDYETNVAEYLGTKLEQLGILKASSMDGIRQYFPHATSHFLGLDVHDVGDYDQPLAPGMVLTCEPGIYIPEESIGVRIEDDVLITENGCRVLSAASSRDL